jgi:hypothetical protein
MHAFLLAVTLAAATGGAGKTAQPAAKHIDIDDDEVVEGTNANPDGEDVLAAKRRRFQSLIHLREDFRREMMKSFDSL